MTDAKPRKCVVTKLGLLILAVVAIAFVCTMVWQRVETGSFSRGAGFVAPLPIKLTVLYGTPAALLLLLVGSIYDSARYSAWKRRRRAAM